MIYLYVTIPLVLAALALGLLIGHQRGYVLGKRKEEARYTQGYNAGLRVGWYNAADEIGDEAEHLMLTTNHRPVVWINGFRSAAEHLNHYWDKVDKGKP
jgi:hypothetical protein